MTEPVYESKYTRSKGRKYKLDSKGRVIVWMPEKEKWVLSQFTLDQFKQGIQSGNMIRSRMP